jgi:hypothetical protein
LQGGLMHGDNLKCTLFNLRNSNIRTAFDNTLWIMGKRVKTNVSYRVPLLDIPKMIIERK